MRGARGVARTIGVIFAGGGGLQANTFNNWQLVIRHGGPSLRAWQPHPKPAEVRSGQISSSNENIPGTADVRCSYASPGGVQASPGTRSPTEYSGGISRGTVVGNGARRGAAVFGGSTVLPQ